MWAVEYTDEFGQWFHNLVDEREKASIRAAVNILAEKGPSLGRPLVDTLADSAYANMKELRPVGTSVRILFAFDPHRIAILLLGGDKAGEWNDWYKVNIPLADRRYEEHLAEINAEKTATKITPRKRGNRRGEKK